MVRERGSGFERSRTNNTLSNKFCKGQSWPYSPIKSPQSGLVSFQTSRDKGRRSSCGEVVNTCCSWLLATWKGVEVGVGMGEGGKASWPSSLWTHFGVEALKCGPLCQTHSQVTIWFSISFPPPAGVYKCTISTPPWGEVSWAWLVLSWHIHILLLILIPHMYFQRSHLKMKKCRSHGDFSDNSHLRVKAVYPNRWDWQVQNHLTSPCLSFLFYKWG